MARHRLALAPDIGEIPRLLDWVERHCRAAAVSDDIALKLALSLEEAVANIVNHAFRQAQPPHRIAIELAIAPDRVAAEVIDNGRPFDPAAAPVPDRTRPLEDRDPGGLGIHLIREMMDRVDYRRADGENRLCVEKKRK